LGLLCLCQGSVWAQYSGGSGTPEDPYQIATAQDLIDLGQTEDDYGKSFVMTAEIDLAGRVFDRAVIAPNTGGYETDFGMGLNTVSIFGGTPFSGRFDGQGHVIRNLCVDERTVSFQGLFGKLDLGAEIANLGLEDVQITGHRNVGGLVGDNFGFPYTMSLSSCYCTGTVLGEENVGGLVGSNTGSISSCYSVCMVSGGSDVGGLVGHSSHGTISSSYSAGIVSGERTVGGLVGFSRSTIMSTHSSAMVSAEKGTAGGLAGNNYESTISSSYSTGRVHGSWQVGGLLGKIAGPDSISSSYSTGGIYGVQGVGGLVGSTYDGASAALVFTGTISSSFWDVESSEQTESIGGIALTTEQMQDNSTYLEAGWDFADESANGSEDIWWMPEGNTPRLWWQYGYAYRPSPIDSASTHMRDFTLQWRAGGPGMQHDVYFGEYEAIVADANTASMDVFLGRLPADTLSYDLSGLEPDKTYYWRIDGVNDVDPAQVWKGPVWSFTVTDFVTVNMLDDFESYDDHCNRIFFSWQDGMGHWGGENVEGCDMAPYAGNGSGAIVGNTDPPYASHVLVRDASQSLPIYYDNTTLPWFSEVERNWPKAQDWTIDDADALTLYFKGEAENIQDPLYIAVEDSRGESAVVYHSSAHAALSAEAQLWHIPLADLDALGVDISAIEKLVIGVGNGDDPQPAATGTLYIDDIQLTKRVP